MKRKVFTVLCLVLTLALTAGVLTACRKSEAKITCYDGDAVIATYNAADWDGSFRPEKEGYEFAGWFTDKELTKPFGNKAESDVSIYAKWQKKTFIVKFIDFDDAILQVNGKDEQRVEYGGAAAAPADPIRAGYKFTGWSVAFDNVKTDITVRALYAPEAGRLVFYDIAGNVVVDSSVETDAPISELIAEAADAVRAGVAAGFGFEWYLDPERTRPASLGEDAVMPPENTAYYAGLTLAPITGAAIASDKTNNTFVWSADSSVTLTAECDEYVGISYAYQWFNNDNAAGEGKSLTLSALDAGQYLYEIDITASADGAESVTATASITLTVTKAALTGVSASGGEFVYEGAERAVSFTGLAEGDIVEYKLGDGEYSSAAPSVKNAGNYAVGVRVTRKNHEPLELSVNFVISPKAVTLTPDDKTAVYGDALPEMSFSASGLIDGENKEVFTGTPVYAYAADSAFKPGEYAISMSGLEAANYSITYGTGTLRVQKRALTVKVEDASVIYGEAAPDFAISYQGFAPGEDRYVLDGTAGISTDYAPGSPVKDGGYAVAVSGLTSDNYEISFVGGTLTVTQRQVTITMRDRQLSGAVWSAALGESNVSGAFASDTLSGVIATTSGAAGNYTLIGPTSELESFVWSEPFSAVSAAGADVTGSYSIYYDLSVVPPTTRRTLSASTTDAIIRSRSCPRRRTPGWSTARITSSFPTLIPRLKTPASTPFISESRLPTEPRSQASATF